MLLHQILRSTRERLGPKNSFPAGDNIREADKLAFKHQWGVAIYVGSVPTQGTLQQRLGYFCFRVYVLIYVDKRHYAKLMLQKQFHSCYRRNRKGVEKGIQLVRSIFPIYGAPRFGFTVRVAAYCCCSSYVLGTCTRRI